MGGTSGSGASGAGMGAGHMSGANMPAGNSSMINQGQFQALAGIPQVTPNFAGMPTSFNRPNIGGANATGNPIQPNNPLTPTNPSNPGGETPIQPTNPLTPAMGNWSMGGANGHSGGAGASGKGGPAPQAGPALQGIGGQAPGVMPRQMVGQLGGGMNA